MQFLGDEDALPIVLFKKTTFEKVLKISTGKKKEKIKFLKNLANERFARLNMLTVSGICV